MNKIFILKSTKKNNIEASSALKLFKKKQAYLITLQLLGGALFSISFFMLGATIGGLLNLVATIRAIIFLFSELLSEELC